MTDASKREAYDKIMAGIIEAHGGRQGELITDLPASSCEAIPGKLAPEGKVVVGNASAKRGPKFKHHETPLIVEDLSKVEAEQSREEYLKAYRAKRLRAMYPPDNSTRYLRRRKLGPDKVEVEKAKADILDKLIFRRA